MEAARKLEASCVIILLAFTFTLAAKAEGDGVSNVPVTATLEKSTVSGNEKPKPKPSDDGGGGDGRHHHDDDGDTSDTVTEKEKIPESPIIPVVYLPGPGETKVKVVRVEKAVEVEKLEGVLPEPQKPVKLFVSGNENAGGKEAVLTVEAGTKGTQAADTKESASKIWLLCFLIFLLLLCLFAWIMVVRRKKKDGGG